MVYSLLNLTIQTLSSSQNNNNPISIKDFRPISLCNIRYKIISKTLANRLKPLFQKCISEEQSTFVEGRSILDNVLIAFDIIHHIRSKSRGKQGEVALKIDISKAFDHVDLNYLISLMSKMGLNNKWLGWIKLCLVTVHYYVMINGEFIGLILLGRGLR